MAIVPLSECIYHENLTIAPIHQICTKTVNGTHAASGDSGGPIFQLREKGNIYSGYVQLGIASRLLAYDKYVSYQDVADYVGWIHRRISGCGNHPFSTHPSNGSVTDPPYPG